MGRIIEIKAWMLDGKGGRLSHASGVPVTFRTKREAQLYADGIRSERFPRRVKITVTWQGR